MLFCNTKVLFLLVLKKKKPAHRPLKYAHKTVIISNRVPADKVAAFRAMVKKWLKKYQAKK
jgi:hypothetical protein